MPRVWFRFDMIRESACWAAPRSPRLIARSQPTMNVFFEIFIIFLLLLANGVFAMAEIAVVSSRKARLKSLADEGNP